MEVTIWAEDSGRRAALGGSAAMQAGTRSERRGGLEKVIAEVDPPGNRGRPPTGREESDERTGRFRRVVASACMEDGRRSNTGSPAGAMHAATGTPRGAGRAGRVAERPVVLKTRGNARRGKGLQVWRDDGGTNCTTPASEHRPEPLQPARQLLLGRTETDPHGSLDAEVAPGTTSRLCSTCSASNSRQFRNGVSETVPEPVLAMRGSGAYSGRRG